MVLSAEKSSKAILSQTNPNNALLGTKYNHITLEIDNSNYPNFHIISLLTLLWKQIMVHSKPMKANHMAPLAEIGEFLWVELPKEHITFHGCCTNHRNIILFFYSTVRIKVLHQYAWRFCLTSNGRDQFFQLLQQLCEGRTLTCLQPTTQHDLISTE